MLFIKNSVAYLLISPMTTQNGCLTDKVLSTRPNFSNRNQNKTITNKLLLQLWCIFYDIIWVNQTKADIYHTAIYCMYQFTIVIVLFSISYSVFTDLYQDLRELVTSVNKHLNLTVFFINIIRYIWIFKLHWFCNNWKVHLGVIRKKFSFRTSIAELNKYYLNSFNFQTEGFA